MIAVYKKEMKSYFTNIIGWLFLLLFLGFAGFFFYWYNLYNGVTNFSYIYGGIELWFVVLMVPVLTMRSIAEENRQKTDQLLYTSPVTIGKIITGKYLALITLFAIAMAVVSTYPLILGKLVQSVATNNESVDYAIAYGSTLGFFLLGCAYIAIGLFISSLTESQIIAAVISGGVMLFTFLMPGLASWLPSHYRFNFWFFAVLIILLAVALHLWIHNVWLSAIVGVLAEVALVIFYILKTDVFTGLIGDVFEGISITARYEDFTLGIFNVSALVYYLSICFLFVFITIQRVKKKRYN